MLDAVWSFVLPWQEPRSALTWKSIGDPILKIIINCLKGFGDKPMRTVRDMQKCLRTTAEVQLLFIYSTAKAP